MNEKLLNAYIDELYKDKKKFMHFYEEFKKYFSDSVWASGYGQHDASWLAFYDYFRNEVGLVEETKELVGLTELSKHCGWFIPHKHICWASEKHSDIKRDEEGRLHSLEGPCVQYTDGWKIYAVHGILINEWIIENPELITIEKIDAEENVEVRRIMVNQYDKGHGEGAYIIDSKAELIDVDIDGCGNPIELYKKERPGDEPVAIIKLINSTKESDGTNKVYFQRVDPIHTKALEAVASTFKKTAEEYKPMVET